MNLKNRKPIFLALLVVGLLLAAAFVLLPRSAAADSIYALSPSEDSEALRLQKLREALASGNLSPDAEESVRMKIAMAERKAAQQAPKSQLAEGAARPPKELRPELLAPAQVESATMQYADEIFEGSEGWVRPSQANILNGWQGQREGKLLQVLAGSQPDDLQQGLLYMIELDLDGANRTVKVYLSSGQTGPLRIEAVQGNLLSLSGENGAQLTFDLTERVFLP